MITLSLPLLIMLVLPFLLLGGLFAFTAVETHQIELAAPPKGQFVTVGDTKLHYTIRMPKGPVRDHVILIHGASGTQADLMEPLGDKLAAKGFAVLAFDRPGLGWSTRPHGRADGVPATQAKLIRAAAEKLGVHKSIIVGHSLAGVVSTNLAITQTDFVEGLVLLAPVTHPWPGGQVDWYYGAAAGPAGWLFTNTITLPMGLATFDRALAGVFGPAPVPENYRARTGVDLVLRPQSFRANAEDVYDIYGAVKEQAPHLHEITAPTTIISGDHDSVILASIHAVGSARDIPGAKLVWIPNIGHSPQWSATDRVVHEITGVSDKAAGKTKPQRQAAG